ncbi:hypothetical protein BDP55DRAFT_649580, partial [Colletotrichum godetiae]
MLGYCIRWRSLARERSVACVLSMPTTEFHACGRRPSLRHMMDHPMQHEARRTAVSQLGTGEQQGEGIWMGKRLVGVCNDEPWSMGQASVSRHVQVRQSEMRYEAGSKLTHSISNPLGVAGRTPSCLH